MADDTPWLSQDELASWRALMSMVEALPAALNAQLKRDGGLNGYEYMVLAGISEAPGRAMTMSDVTKYAAGSISRLSHAVSRLENQGYLERRPYAADGRHTEVALTQAGWKKIREVAPGHALEARRLVVDVLTPEQMAALGEISRTIVEASDPQLAERLPRRGEQGPQD